MQGLGSISAHLWPPKKAGVYLCVQQRKKKLIGCLVGLGNLPGTQLLSSVTVRVGENSIYMGPPQAGGVGAYDHHCIGEEVEWRPPLL